MGNSISCKWDLWMVAALVCVAVVLGIYLGFAAFFAVMSTVAMAGIWELVEWIYAEVEGGAAGAAFLGSQGDLWDAQKDILCDTLGAICASMLFLIDVKRR